jgi:HAD superfamily hydrolase (TIGR01549 family)
MKIFKPKIIVYDFDGVIVDSEKAVFKFYDIICEEFNLKKIDLSNKYLVNKILMLTTEDALKLICNNEAIIAEIKQFINSSKFTGLSNYIRLQPYIDVILKTLKDKKIQTAIFTNRGESLYYLLKHFNIEMYFDYFVTCNDVTEPKPSSEGLLKIIEYFNINQNEVLYIGDSIIDKLAAENIQVPFIFYNHKSDKNINIKNHLELVNYIG